MAVERPTTARSANSPTLNPSESDTVSNTSINAATEKRVTQDERKSGSEAKPEYGAKPDDDDDTTPEYSSIKVAILLGSVLLSIFLVALDRTIIATAIPRITDEFNSLPDVGWYGSAYTLASCSLQLLLGKIYTFYPVKAVLLGNIILFEAGSAICGAAPNSVAFIVGRAISGVGGSGIFSGCIVVVVYAVPMEKRPKIQGLFGAIFGIASIVGPLIGGAFTSSSATWRWCFYINLPFGGVSMVVVCLFLQIPDRDTTKASRKEKLLQLDGPGTASLITSMICLLLALQWGGQKYEWSNGRIVALLVVSAVLGIIFVLVQIFLPKTATIPPRIFKQRSIVAGCWATWMVGSSSYIFTYFLPIWFQSIKGVSAVQSGIRLLPLMLSMVFASITGGVGTGKIGYYTPFAIVGACIMSVGAGLLTTLQVDTSEAKWIGYQILYGLGMGWTFQAPNLAAQTVLPKRDVAIGSSLMFFSQLLGATVFVSVAQNVLDSQLVGRLSGVPGFEPSMVTSGGATSIIAALPNSQSAVIHAFNESLRVIFRIGLVLACLAVLGAAGLEWKSTKKKEPQVSPEGAAIKSTEAEGSKEEEVDAAA